MRVSGMVRGLADGAVGGARSTAALARSGVWRSARPNHLPPVRNALRCWGSSIATLAAVGAARFPDRDAVIDERGSITYAELDRRAAAQAAALHHELGIRAGSKVAMLCRNHRGLVEATIAASRLGADVMFLNTEFAAPRLAEVLERHPPDLLVLDEEFVALLDTAGVDVERVLAWRSGSADGRDLDDLAAGAPSDPPAPARPGTLTILTSGTTGRPKSAPRSPTAVAFTGLAATIVTRTGIRAGEPMAICPPLFHGLGLLFWTVALFLGNPIVLSRKFDAATLLASVEQHRIGAALVVPVMMQRLLELPGETVEQVDTSSLRAVISGAAALSPALATRFMDRFGEVVSDAYGSSEVGIVTLAGPAELRENSGTVGRPCLASSIRILDDADEPLPVGETGRVFAGGRLVFGGYAEGGSRDLVDKRMSTGDLGHLDAAGRLFIDGRDDDLIVSGGENVYPVEVENCLAAHPAVAEAAVIGVDDPDFGQRLVAYVVPAPTADIDTDELKIHVKANLARYKAPREIVIVDELPRNATGKVLRSRLG